MHVPTSVLLSDAMLFLYFVNYYSQSVLCSTSEWSLENHIEAFVVVRVCVCMQCVCA